MPSDIFNLQRFLEAQNPVYSEIIAELAKGKKQTHWMWFVFPQLLGLGHSQMARRYALTGIDEARAYLAHTLLGVRLRECANLVNQQHGVSAFDIFGTPDHLKFHSSMTLFDAAEPRSIFAAALDQYFTGTRDRATLSLLDNPTLQ
jgi:uncharacterized protein (DUF1810 family)